MAHLADDLREGIPGLTNQRDAASTLHGALPNQCLDIERRLGRVLGERAHFVGYSREPPGGIARVRVLDPGDERDWVGLERDPVDNRNDLADFPGGIVTVGHGLHCLVAHAATRLRIAVGTLHSIVKVDGIIRRAADAGGQRAHSGGGDFKAGGLLFGAAGQVFGSLADLLRTHVDRL